MNRDGRRGRRRERRTVARVAGAIDRAVAATLPEVCRLGDSKESALWRSRCAINYGYCEDVAVLAVDELKRLGLRAMVLRDDDGLCVQDEVMHDAGWTHAWVWAEGRHYDAEARRGVDRWIELPHFRRWRVPDPPEFGELRELAYSFAPLLDPGVERELLFGLYRLSDRLAATMREKYGVAT